MVHLMENIGFKDKPLEERKKLVRLVVARMLKAYKLENTKALAGKLECTHGAIKNWGSAGRIPMDPLFQCHSDTGISMDWLIHGEPPVMVFDHDKVEQLTMHLNTELSSAVRYQLIEEKRKGCIDSLVSGLSESLVKFLGVKVVDSHDLPYHTGDKK